MRRTVLHIWFADGPSPRDWWLVLDQDAAEASSHRPPVPRQCGSTAQPRLSSTSGVVIATSWQPCATVIRFTGDRETAHAVLRWIRTSQFAHN